MQRLSFAFGLLFFMSAGTAGAQAVDFANLAIAGPYDTAVAGTGNFSCGSACRLAPGSKEFLTVGQRYRIREDGTLARVRLYTYSKSNLTALYVKIWRKNGSTYDLVGTSNNLVNDLVAGSIATVDLATPIPGVKEGDYYGFRIEASDATNHFYARLNVTGVTSYWVTNTVPAATGYAWESRTASAGAVFPIELYEEAPQAVFIGDSIIAGWPTHHSFLEIDAITNISGTIERQFDTLTGLTYQNMGVGGQTSVNVAARFQKDLIALKPRYAVLEGGLNDIAYGGSRSAFLNAWAQMLSAAQADANVVKIAVVHITPWTAGTNDQMRQRDDWNAALTDLAYGYSKAVVVDVSSAVGQNRPDGDAGNLWDIKTEYAVNGVHFNAAGNLKIAEVIATSLGLYVPACP